MLIYCNPSLYFLHSHKMECCRKHMLFNLLRLRLSFEFLSLLAKTVNGHQHSTTSNMFSLYQLCQHRLKRGYTTKALVFHTAIWAISNQV